MACTRFRTRPGPKAHPPRVDPQPGPTSRPTRGGALRGGVGRGQSTVDRARAATEKLAVHWPGSPPPATAFSPIVYRLSKTPPAPGPKRTQAGRGGRARQGVGPGAWSQVPPARPPRTLPQNPRAPSPLSPQRPHPPRPIKRPFICNSRKRHRRVYRGDPQAGF